MKRAQLLAGVMSLALTLGLSAALHGQKVHDKATIMAVSKDGNTWVAGEVKFKVVGDDTLEVSIDLDSGVPDAQVLLYTQRDPWEALSDPALQLVRTDKHGRVKYTQSTGINTPDSFDVWVEVTVDGAAVMFTSQQEPVTIVR